MNIAPDLEPLLYDVDLLDELPGNPRRGDVEAVKRSYERFGQRKPIVARRDKDGRATVVAGNHQLRAVRELGWERVAVTFADDLTDDEARGFALADNRVADLGGYDDAAVLALLDDLPGDIASATGYTDLDVKRLENAVADAATPPDPENPYSNKVEAPHYEIKGDNPPTTALYDDTRYRSLVEQLDGADVPDDVRRFLLLAAGRHVVFDYGKVAEFYAHQPADVQSLMEASALVIVDFEDAIRGGFVKMSETLEREWESDYAAYDG